MKPLYLWSNILVVKEIKCNTKAEVFKDWQVGDEIQLTMPFKGTPSYYADYVTVWNLTQDTKVIKSQRELKNILQIFTIEEANK